MKAIRVAVRGFVGIVLLAGTLGGCATQALPSPDAEAVATEREQYEEKASQPREFVNERHGESHILPSLSVIEAEVVITSSRSPVRFEDAPLVRIEADGPVASVYVLSADEGAEREYAELSRIARAYEPSAEMVDLYVEAFAYIDGGLRLVHTVGLGSVKSIGTFRVFPLSSKSADPTCVALETYSAEGTEVRWVLFTEDEPPSRFDLETSGRVTSRVEDLDGDGLLDVVTTRREAEPGVGYEAYITLYEWNGRRMAQTESLPIVRSLSRFLDRAMNHLANERWMQFVSLVAPGLAESLSSEAEAADAVRDVLDTRETIGPAPNPYGYLDLERDVTDVFSPPILENPFRQSRRFRQEFRVSTDDGASYIVSALVTLSENPFADPIFTFAIRD